MVERAGYLSVLRRGKERTMIKPFLTTLDFFFRKGLCS